jgi:hypothetical protein
MTAVMNFTYFGFASDCDLPALEGFDWRVFAFQISTS